MERASRRKRARGNLEINGLNLYWDYDWQTSLSIWVTNSTYTQQWCTATMLPNTAVEHKLNSHTHVTQSYSTQANSKLKWKKIRANFFFIFFRVTTKWHIIVSPSVTFLHSFIFSHFYSMPFRDSCCSWLYYSNDVAENLWLSIQVFSNHKNAMLTSFSMHPFVIVCIK